MCRGFVLLLSNCAAASSLDKTFVWLRALHAQLIVESNVLNCLARRILSSCNNYFRRIVQLQCWLTDLCGGEIPCAKQKFQSDHDTLLCANKQEFHLLQN